MEVSISKLIGGAIILVLYASAELTVRVLRRRRKNAFSEGKLSVTNARELEELTLSYNKDNQVFDILRLVFVIIAVFLAILDYDVQAFSVFVLGFGAIVVIMRESVISFIAYFHILAGYHVGDDIKIGETLGEISKMGPLFTSITGKEESGEYNGKLVHVPNFLFLQQRIEMQSLKSTNYRRTWIVFTLRGPLLSDSAFSDLVSQIRQFLDELLPVRLVEEIGHFRSYAGRRYRFSLDYDGEGRPTMRISFVAHPDQLSALREKIIVQLESLRLVASQDESTDVRQ